MSVLLRNGPSIPRLSVTIVSARTRVRAKAMIGSGASIDADQLRSASERSETSSTSSRPAKTSRCLTPT